MCATVLRFQMTVHPNSVTACFITTLSAKCNGYLLNWWSVLDIKFLFFILVYKGYESQAHKLGNLLYIIIVQCEGIICLIDILVTFKHIFVLSPCQVKKTAEPFIICCWLGVEWCPSTLLLQRIAFISSDHHTHILSFSSTVGGARHAHNLWIFLSRL